ncbi:MAG: GNAT family N-acetyltransferase [Promethearchaeota archaeon]
MKKKIVWLEKRDIKTTGSFLGEIFQDDPANLHGFPNAITRQRRIIFPFCAIVRYGIRYGEVIALSEDEKGDVLAVAVVARIENLSEFYQKFVLCGLQERILHIGIRAIRRFSKLEKYMHEAHTKYASQPHLYLMAIGVKKELQGHGLGSQLLGHIIAKSEKEGLPIYLETELLQNVNFYEKHNFKILEKVQVPKTNVEYWFMQYEPSEQLKK